MVFGFGKGKIEMTLNKYGFGFGETITGTVNLQLKKPYHARGLYVRLLGEEISSHMERDSDGNMRRETRRHKLWDQKIPISGEMDYSGGQYNFQLPTPAQAPYASAPGGTVGTVMQAAAYLSGVDRRYEWHVIAYLDIPKGFDVKKKQQINLG